METHKVPPVKIFELKTTEANNHPLPQLIYKERLCGRNSSHLFYKGSISSTHSEVNLMYFSRQNGDFIPDSYVKLRKNLTVFAQSSILSSPEYFVHCIFTI